MYTLSFLLNCHQWMKSYFLIVYFFYSLDPALIRPGRVDLRVHIDLCDRSQLVHMFNRFYPQRRIEPSEITNTTNQLHTMAETFGDLLEDVQLSSAQVQGYFLMHKDDPYGAIKNIDQLKACVSNV